MDTNTQKDDFFVTDLERQHDYAQSIESKGEAAFTLVAVDAFVRGMRDSGYRSTANAIDEFIDNSKQAEASRVDVVAWADKGGRGNKSVVSQIAVIDDGHGMEPSMLRASVLWGGTHREDDRSGLGRYGFGLPSAAASLTETYAVYSKTPTGKWYCIEMNLRAVASGHHTDSETGHVKAPLPQEASLPDVVTEYLKAQKWNLESGTIMLLIQPDKLTTGFVRPSSFEAKMMEKIGTTYRGMLGDCKMHVNGKPVQCADPLFLMSGCRFYDVGNGRLAEAATPHVFMLKTKDGQASGQIRLRFSVMAPDFQLDDDEKLIKERFKIMKDNHNWFSVCRVGRQIDAVKSIPVEFSEDSDLGEFNLENKNPWRGFGKLNNYDANWGAEIDFDPILDEEFGVTVNKQQIVISERVWAALANQGVPAMLLGLRTRFRTLQAEYAATKDDGGNEEKPKDSEVIMEIAEPISRKKPRSSQSAKDSQEKIERDAKKQAEDKGVSAEEAVKEILDVTDKRPYKVLTEAIQGGAFFRPEQYGSQTRLWINTEHRFYKDIYTGAEADERLRAAIELLLFTLSKAELTAAGDKKMFYEYERDEWSRELRTLLELLEKKDSLEDKRDAVA